MACLILGLALWDMSRSPLHMEGEPAFSLARANPLLIELKGLGTGIDGVRHLNGCNELLSAIKMTVVGPGGFDQQFIRHCTSYESGKLIEFKVVNGKIISFHEGWMTAAKRMALGLSLEADQMQMDDWSDLPGVGPSLAKAISEDRQKNGEFESYRALLRVKGVGEKSLKKWKIYFKEYK